MKSGYAEKEFFSHLKLCCTKYQLKGIWPWIIPDKRLGKGFGRQWMWKVSLVKEAYSDLNFPLPETDECPVGGRDGNHGL